MLWLKVMNYLFIWKNLVNFQFHMLSLFAWLKSYIAIFPEIIDWRIRTWHDATAVIKVCACLMSEIIVGRKRCHHLLLIWMIVVKICRINGWASWEISWESIFSYENANVLQRHAIPTQWLLLTQRRLCRIIINAISWSLQSHIFREIILQSHIVAV